MCKNVRLLFAGERESALEWVCVFSAREVGFVLGQIVQKLEEKPQSPHRTVSATELPPETSQGSSVRKDECKVARVSGSR